jgi:hypothetical protein
MRANMQLRIARVLLADGCAPQFRRRSLSS